jgi:hypothetical protein
VQGLVVDREGAAVGVRDEPEVAGEEDEDGEDACERGGGGVLVGGRYE